MFGINPGGNGNGNGNGGIWGNGTPGGNGNIFISPVVLFTLSSDFSSFPISSPGFDFSSKRASILGVRIHMRIKLSKNKKLLIIIIFEEAMGVFLSLAVRVIKKESSCPWSLVLGLIGCYIERREIVINDIKS